MNRRFLPGVFGADVPVNDRIGAQNINRSVTEGNGPLSGQTRNYDLNLVNFDWTTWHDYEWENWIQVDALIFAAIGFLNLRGIWRANTEYTAGDSVFDPEDTTKVYLCEASHTSGTNFQTDLPLYWVERQEATPPVSSVFGRIGAVTAQANDYASFYSPIGHTHTEAQIIDLDKYTQAEINAQQSAQDAEIAARLTDAPFDGEQYVRRNGAWEEVFIPPPPTQDFLPLTGGTLTGTLIVDGLYNALLVRSGGSKRVAFQTSAGTNQGEIISTANDLRLRNNRAANATQYVDLLVTEDDVLITSGGGASLNTELVPQSVILAGRGDARYLRRAGDGMTGPISIRADDINLITLRSDTPNRATRFTHLNNGGMARSWYEYDESVSRTRIRHIAANGTDIKQFNLVDEDAQLFGYGTDSPNALSVITRERGDQRYALASDIGPVEIVEADTTSGWQVWGDTLVQWGVADTTASPGQFGVVFPQQFKDTVIPAVTLSALSNVNVTRTAHLRSVEYFQFVCATLADGATAGMSVRWVAIGEAPDALKKPKTVQTIGGAELQEYHDPTGVASWRIVGNTLECWGTTEFTFGVSAVSFPKTFARRPAFTATVSGLAGDIAADVQYVVMSETPNVSGATLRQRYRDNNQVVLSEVPCDWHAIGEWDGVS